jgi:mannose-1-phosphate guanylyltransferase/mannose-6-phosphate isomerase
MYAIILAGGSGTRFWPLSREMTPKQMLRVFGDTTMIQQTVSRVGASAAIKKIIIITGKNYAFDIRRQIAEVCAPGRYDVLIEPAGKNTAPAVGLAAVHIRKKSPDAVMSVMPSDHVILKQDEFARVLKKAEETARKGYLTTIGIVPDRPETGYGYIKKGLPLERSKKPERFRVERFVEKPDLKQAKKYIRSGDYLWNSGIFVWRVSDILAEIKKQQPDLYKGLLEIEKAIGKKNELDVLNDVFSRFRSVSIDYGIMENAAKAAVVPADMGWNDVGSWRALDDISEKDASGNIITGNVVDIGSRDSIIYAGKRLVATIGLEGAVIVDTPDATLICNKNNTQDVRKVVDELKKKSADELVEHMTVHRPWGSYTVLEVGSRYKIKRIEVNPGAKLSFQLHHHRSEHWVVVSGTALVTVGDKTSSIHPNESTYVPVSTKHRLENPGKVPLQLIEVQNGDYIEEDDIVRFDDDYGRSGKGKQHG